MLTSGTALKWQIIDAVRANPLSQKATNKDENGSF